MTIQPPARSPRADNIEAFDRFTIGHGMVGFCLGLWGMPWWAALTSTVTFELVENLVLKPSLPRMFPVGRPDSLANATVDSAAWMGGWALARTMFPGDDDRAPIWRRPASSSSAPRTPIA